MSARRSEHGAASLYTLGIGVVVGLVLAGLVTPFLLADRTTTRVVSAPVSTSGASDPGVTETSIKVGFTSPDLTRLGNFGFGDLDSGDARGRYQALVDAVNAGGGINGRTIEPVFTTYDFVEDSATGAQGACTAMVTDQQVFAVVDAGPFPASGVSCYTGQQIPFLTLNGYNERAYESGYLFTAFPSYERSLRDQVAYLDARGLLDGRTIGVFTDVGGARDAVESALVPAVEAAGQRVVDVEAVNEDATALQQAPVVLSNFKANNVDFVIVAALPLFARLLPGLAAQQGLQPVYAYSDFYNELADVYGDYGPGASGAIGVTATRVGDARGGIAAPDADQECLDRLGGAEQLVRDEQPYVVAMYQCAMFDLFVAAATKAGPQLTHAGFVAAADQTGTIDVPNSATGSIGAGKHDLLDGIRRVTYDSACPCWVRGDDDFAVPE